MYDLDDNYASLAELNERMDRMLKNSIECNNAIASLKVKI